jgi:hypothetical protein
MENVGRKGAVDNGISPTCFAKAQKGDVQQQKRPTTDRKSPDAATKPGVIWFAAAR